MSRRPAPRKKRRSQPEEAPAPEQVAPAEKKTAKRAAPRKKP